MSENLSFQDLYADSLACIGKSDKISEATSSKIKILQDQRDKLLSVNATKCCESRGRLKPEANADIRNCFERDMGRIIYSQAFRRLKHKTQVFFNPANDHICSRLEHVIYVDYIASTIGNALNLNVDLIKAIALGHDVGHTPFGHSGERILNKKLKEIDDKLYFEHESNGLRVLNILEKRNAESGLNLTFEVRDGIISHCGEYYSERKLEPCKDKTEEDLSYLTPKKLRKVPATMEGCVVRFADKIAYVGRDIEDALRTGVIANEFDVPVVVDGMGSSNSEIINFLVQDIIENSMDKNSIMMSDHAGDALEHTLNENVSKIYTATSVKTYEKYCDVMLEGLFDAFYQAVQNIDRAYNSRSAAIRKFSEFVYNHPEYKANEDTPLPIYVSDYIAGMTDSFAVTCFNEIYKS
ncbi:MAG: dNTP triphosphohydrolase [Saccharofermentans sp.]|nr:dNTP triphosphohydrolase [Saccharofermentans sp.]